MGKTIPEAEIVQIALAETEGVAVAVGVDGIRRFYGFATVKMSPRQGRIHLIVGIPTNVALADAKRNLARNLAGLILVALLSLAVAWWGGERFILRPVSALVRTIEKLGAGRSRRAHRASSRHERDRSLAASFDQMAET